MIKKSRENTVVKPVKFHFSGNRGIVRPQTACKDKLPTLDSNNRNFSISIAEKAEKSGKIGYSEQYEKGWRRLCMVFMYRQAIRVLYGGVIFDGEQSARTRSKK